MAAADACAATTTGDVPRMTYEELLSIAQAWMGYRDTNQCGWSHNLSALSVFNMMYEHANPFNLEAFLTGQREQKGA